jgi:hypothetical protein
MRWDIRVHSRLIARVRYGNYKGLAPTTEPVSRRPFMSRSFAARINTTFSYEFDRGVRTLGKVPLFKNRHFERGLVSICTGQWLSIAHPSRANLK